MLPSWSSPFQIVQEPLRHLAPEVPASKLQAKANFRVNWISSLQAFIPLPCSFCCCHTVLLLNTGTAQFVNLPLLLTMVHWLVHNSSRVEATEKGWLVQAVLWWLPPWEPKQRKAVFQSLFPNHALQAVWLRQDSSYSCTWYQLFPFPLHPAGYLNLTDARSPFCMSFLVSSPLGNLCCC